MKTSHESSDHQADELEICDISQFCETISFHQPRPLWVPSTPIAPSETLTYPHFAKGMTARGRLRVGLNYGQRLAAVRNPSSFCFSR